MSRIADALKRASEIALPREEGRIDSSHGVERSPLEQYGAETVEFPSQSVAEVKERIEPVAHVSEGPERARAAHRPPDPRPPELPEPWPHVQATRSRIDPAFGGKVVGTRGMSAEAAGRYEKIAAALQDIQSRSEWNGPGAPTRGLKTLLVSSAVASEGKTLTAVNLALTLSEHFRRRVLLIDANLQHPSVHNALGLGPSRGLSDMLRSDAMRAVPFQMISPLLSVVPAGGFDGNRTEDLTSERMKALLAESAFRFDWIVLDGPSVHGLPRARDLARLTRAVLMVVASGSTPYPAVDRAIAELGRGCLVGTVLNRVKAR